MENKEQRIKKFMKKYGLTPMPFLQMKKVDQSKVIVKPAILIGENGTIENYGE